MIAGALLEAISGSETNGERTIQALLPFQGSRVRRNRHAAKTSNAAPPPVPRSSESSSDLAAALAFQMGFQKHWDDFVDLLIVKIPAMPGASVHHDAVWRGWRSFFLSKKVFRSCTENRGDASEFFGSGLAAAGKALERNFGSFQPYWLAWTGIRCVWPSADAGVLLQTRLLLAGRIRFHRKYSHLNFGCPFFFVSRAPRFFFRRVVFAVHNEGHEHEH
ncbi:MAG: hypothetical protein IIT89_04340 [Aeriscardovia sp.]|nr:hypothetical protein [Aeriscardovia sp.]